jgi:triacylglycerol lipase
MRLPVAALALVAAALLAAPAAAQQSYPYGPDDVPTGANDPACRPTAERPEPVVLVHGLGANMKQNWEFFAPRLARAGHCVWALTYGRKRDNPPPFDQNGGTIGAEESAEQLAAFVDAVLERTGARQVDLVGHSEGSIMPTYYLKFLEAARHDDGTPKVDDYVALTPLWDGTDVGGFGTMRETFGYEQTQPVASLAEMGCRFCTQALKGSPFIRKVNEGGGPAVEGVTYTTVMTRYDELVVPYTSGVLEGAENHVLQELCAGDPVEHMGVAFDALALNITLNALDPSRALPEDCTAYLGAW